MAYDNQARGSSVKVRARKLGSPAIAMKITNLEAEMKTKFQSITKEYVVSIATSDDRFLFASMPCCDVDRQFPNAFGLGCRRLSDASPHPSRAKGRIY